MIQQPVAVGLALCEQVIVEETTRNITLVNCFTRLHLRNLPAEATRLAVFAALTDGIGDATISLVVHRLDTMEELYNQEYRVRFSDPLQEVRVLFRLNRLVFPSAVRYQFALMADGELIAHRVAQVIEME
jgi:hypothetical protein